MKNVVESVKTFISKLEFKDILIILSTLLFLYFMFSARYYRNMYKYETVIYEDTITSYKNKLKEEYASKAMYIQTIDQLKQNNEELYAEIKSLKDNPVIVTKTDLQIKLDTVYMNNDGIDEYTKLDSTYYDLKWSMNNQYYNIAGITTVNPLNMQNFSTTLTNLQMPVKLSIDIVEEKNKFRIIGKSDNPYVQIQDFNSVFIDPSKSKVLRNQFKPKKWVIGPQFGYGFTKDMQMSPFLGIGITYGIIRF